MEKLQDNLVIARKAKGWTLKDAENHTGIKIVTIGSYERGYRLPPLNMLQRLANHYEVSIGSLLGEECPACALISNTLSTQIISLQEATNGITLRN